MSQVYGEIASTISSMGLSVARDHAIEEGLVRIPVALLHSHTALQLKEAADHCLYEENQLVGSALLRQIALRKHGWKVAHHSFLGVALVAISVSCSLVHYRHAVCAVKPVM